MYGYIYLIFCTLNGKMYIGARRWNDINTLHKDTYMGSGTLLKKDMEKYGKEYFHKRILAIARNLKELNHLEQVMIKRFNAVKSPMFYNIAKGGGIAPLKKEGNANARYPFTF